MFDCVYMYFYLFVVIGSNSKPNPPDRRSGASDDPPSIDYQNIIRDRMGGII